MTRSLASLVVLAAASSLGAAGLVRFQAPRPLAFDDLVALAIEDPPPPRVEARLERLLSTPFLSNEATFAGARPLAPDPAGVGEVLRVAEWNINREEQESMLLALSDLRGYEALARENPKLNPKRLRQAVEEARHLQAADVIVLNEVDHGVKRTGYHDVTRDIAMRLHMNYVFATEFIELTPLYVHAKNMDSPDRTPPKRTPEDFGVDRKRYLGLEGSALLSRYPIRSARIVRLPDAYDWYHGEINAISDLSKIQKWTAEKLFAERLRRQVRRGGRIMIIAELEVPGHQPEVLTVVCPHLEDYSDPKGRRKQMDFVLSQIRSISTPLVMAGDLNTMNHNGAPVTPKRAVKDFLLNYRFWLREAVYQIEPVPGLHYAISGLNYVKNFHDPTAVSVPVLAPNDSRALFEDVHKFLFEDGSQFAWEAPKRESFHHKGGTLSVTNQRGWKGFEPTFAFARTFHGLFGSYKLDWIFVKEPAGFAPSQGRTLRRLNTAPAERISDHSPTTVDLALPSRGTKDSPRGN